jgi:hypothetical protein
VLATQVGEGEAALPSHQASFVEEDLAIVLDQDFACQVDPDRHPQPLHNMPPTF